MRRKPKKNKTKTQMVLMLLLCHELKKEQIFARWYNDIEAVGYEGFCKVIRTIETIAKLASTILRKGLLMYRWVVRCKYQDLLNYVQRHERHQVCHVKVTILLISLHMPTGKIGSVDNYPMIFLQPRKNRWPLKSN